MVSQQVILTFFFSIALIVVYANGLLKKTPVLRIARFRHQLGGAFLINVICYASVALYFNYHYGYITDDKNYFNGALDYSGGFSGIASGNDFMYYISRPLRLYLDLDRPSFHILFGAMGFCGSLNFLFVLSKTIDFFNKKQRKENAIKLFSVLCFPNMMAWGRFYGKDSTALFLGSVYCIGAYNLIMGSKRPWRNILLAAMPILLLYKLRPHIAAVFAISLLIGMYLNSANKRNLKTSNREILFRVLIPAVLAIALTIGTIYSLKNLTKKETVSFGDVQHSLAGATSMGASGGSATKLTEELNENQDIIFTPRQIAINVGMILFAPMPWQIHGFADGLAFFSNILLLFLAIRFGKKIDFTSVFQKYLIVICSLLIILLSYMTGNVGLILRQKTIILPFLFLFLFHRPPLLKTKTL